MYSLEERAKAVKLFIESDCSERAEFQFFYPYYRKSVAV